MKNKYTLDIAFKRNSICLILAFLSFCCKNLDDSKKNGNIKGTFSIEEGYFKDEIKKVIIQFNRNPKFKKNSFLIEYYCRETDTVVEFSYAEPYTCENILGHILLDGNNVFLYAKSDNPKMIKDFKINQQFLDCTKYVNERDIDSPPRIFYHVKNGYVISRY